MLAWGRKGREGKAVAIHTHSHGPNQTQRTGAAEAEAEAEEEEGSRYGLGTERSLAAYEALLGVDFQRGLFRSSAALWGGQRPDFFDWDGPVLGAEECADTAKAATAALSAVAAGVLGTRKLQAIVGSFLSGQQA